MAYVIGVDIGTSGTKTVLFDEKGSVIASKTIEYPMYQPKNGYAEQEPADWANAAINTIKAVVAESGVKKEDVKGKTIYIVGAKMPFAEFDEPTHKKMYGFIGGNTGGIAFTFMVYSIGCHCKDVFPRTGIVQTDTHRIHGKRI